MHTAKYELTVNGVLKGRFHSQLTAEAAAATFEPAKHIQIFRITESIQIDCVVDRQDGVVKLQK